MENKPKKIDAAPPENKEEKKLSAVQVGAAIMAEQVRFARFRGRPMVEVSEPYPHFVPLTRERFDELGYARLGGQSRSRMADIFAFISNTAPDLTMADNLIGFGDRVWDMQTLKFIEHDPRNTVWRSPYAPAPAPEAPTTFPPNSFIMDLAGGDDGVYDDIMQSLAPLVMDNKPDGVIWWVGNGANGKSTLMEAIYRIFPGQLSSLTVKSLTDGRDTPRLNGTLANVVKESSEGRIDDTEIYKAVGTHEDFTIHKFHSQDTMTIRGNLHHIFSGNSVPTFNDKGWSARRRTFIVPFVQRFPSDPNFEARTFTPELFADLVAEMCRYAVRLRDQGLRYKWSAATLAAKAEYDVEANNAEEYAREIIQQGVVGFESFGPLKMDYENWCAEQGYVPLGINNLRKAISSSGFERRSIKTGGGVTKLYLIPTVKPGEYEESGMGRVGMYIVRGFVPVETPPVPDFREPDDAPEPPTPPKTKVKGDWFE